MRSTFVPLAIMLAAGSVSGAGADADTPELIGRWIGTLHTIGGTCPDQKPSTLMVNRRRISFAPADGVLVLRGVRTPESSRLHAQLEPLGMDHKPVPMVFEAHPQGKAIAGLYGTPTCRAEIRLRRPGD